MRLNPSQFSLQPVVCRCVPLRAILLALALVSGGAVVQAQNWNSSSKPILIPASNGRGGLAVAPDGRVAELVFEARENTSRGRLLYRERRRGGSPTNWEVVASDVSSAFQQSIPSFSRGGVASVIYVEEFIIIDSAGRYLSGLCLRERVRRASGWSDGRAWPLFNYISSLQSYLPWDPYSMKLQQDFVFVRRGDAIDVVGHNGNGLYYRRLTDGPLLTTESLQQVVDDRRKPWSYEFVRDPARSATTLNGFDVPPPVWSLGQNPRNLSAAFDPAGRLHVVYSKNQQVQPIPGGTIQRSSLFYISRQPNGVWSKPRELNSPGSGFGDGGIGSCIAAAPNGVVAIAASFVPRVRTGSTAGRAELRYFVLGPSGSWSSSVVASASDNYVAGDGERGTGLEPWLVFDARSRPSIVFTDHASEHQPSDWSYSGQVRLASRASAKSGPWTVRTLVSRSGVSPLNFTTWRPAIASTVGGVAVAAPSFKFNPASRTFSSRYDFKTASIPARKSAP